jgi:hypothetical protein
MHCVAGGYYRGENSYDTYPLLAHSKNRGDTWSYVIDKTTPSLPEGFKKGGLNSVACAHLHCIAVGYYRTNEKGLFPLDTDLPLIASSQDRGKTWVYTLDGTTPELPGDFEPGTLTKASCSGPNCVAIGNFGLYAHILFSNNAGRTWEWVVDSQKPKSPVDLYISSLSSLSCSELNCIAAGYYYANTNTYPVLLSSQDGGAHWHYAIDSSTPGLPSPDFVFGWFSSVSCSKENCVAVGMYNKGNAYPLIAHSSNGGKNWVYAVDSDKPLLPADLANGQLYNALCGGRLLSG